MADIKKALVTGSAGFVGRHMTAELERRGYHVTGWDLPGYDANRMFRTVFTRFDLVVHLAYHVGGRAAIDSSKVNLARNLALDAALFEWAARTNPAAVLYFSSSAAYPLKFQVKYTPYRLSEDKAGDGNPDADYGWAKLTGERLARNYAAAGGRVHVVRPFSGYAADQPADYPFPSFVERARRRADPFEVWGDPTSVRDWIHVSDVVNGALAVVEADYRDPVNLCTGVGTSMEKLARLCMAAAGYEAPVVPVPGSPYGVHTRLGVPDRFFRFYRPKVTIEQGVADALSAPVTAPA